MGVGERIGWSWESDLLLEDTAPLPCGERVRVRGALLCAYTLTLAFHH